MIEESGQPARQGPNIRSGLAIAAAAVLLAACGSFVYWRYILYPQSPQYALGQFLDAAIKEDYDIAYRRLYLAAPLKLIVPSAEALERLAHNAGGVLPKLRSYRLGTVKVEDDRATIRAVLHYNQNNGSPMKAADADIVMIKDRDAWKVDGAWVLMEASSRGVDAIGRSLFH